MLYVIDSTAEFAKSLRNEGWEITEGSLGYSKRSPLLVSLEHPPHEAQAIVYNLEEPACYDGDAWGSTNSNTKCSVVSKINDSCTYDDLGKRFPRFRLVSSSQFEHKSQKSQFYSPAILRAVHDGGLPLIIMLNEVQVVHAYPHILEWLGIDVYCTTTVANDYYVEETLKSSYSKIEEYLCGKAKIKTPLKVRVDLIRPRSAKDVGTRIDIIRNLVGDSFFTALPYGKGIILLAPAFENQAAAITGLVEIGEQMITSINDWKKKSEQKIQEIRRELIAKRSEQNKPQTGKSIIDAIKSFEKCSHRLVHRRKGKEPFEVKDEYDVQDILWVMLAPYFSDIVYETPAEKKAEKSAFVDFRVPCIKTLVEVKHASKTNNWKTIKEQIDSDITQYKQQWPDHSVVFVVHDAQNIVPNKETIEADYKKHHAHVSFIFLP